MANRREFIKTSALAGGGLLLSFNLPASINRFMQAAATSPVFAPNAFLRISADNTITIILTKVEMGQGIWTTLPTLVAEELDCDWKHIKIEHSPAGKDYADPQWGQSTGGSMSTSSEFERYRRVGATARVMLVAAAAKTWGITPAECKTANGYVTAGNRQLSYGELAAEAATQPVPETVPLRPPAEWKYIGKSRQRLDSPNKLNGQAKYGIDLQFPGLLTAVVAHAPVFGGKVRSFNAAKAKAIKGVRAVVEIPTGIAVLADHYWAARQGCEALIIDWDPGPHATIDSRAQLEEYRRLAQNTGAVSQQKGTVATGLQKAARTIEREYTVPYLAHAAMEPMNCTVKLEKDRCEIWVGNQSPLLYQEMVAKLLGLTPEQVTIHTPFIGGSFGRKASFDGDWIIEAVHIARASGRFIKLVWSREDDMKAGYYRPVYLHRAQIGINGEGLPTAWHHHIVGQSIFHNTILEKLIVNNNIDYSSVDGVNWSPYLTSVPDHTVELHTTTVGVPVHSWRAVGNTHTAFVMESLIDELAILAGQDPVAYRRLLLKDHPRHLATLNLAAEKAGWGSPLPAGRFRGIAVHAAMGSVVAQVVELSVVNQKIDIHRVVCAIDCGQVVNPDGVRAQMEGGIVFGLTAALYGEITLEQGKVQQSNFHNYRMLRMREMPLIEVYTVEGQGPMGGAGEPGVPPIAPALTNALFAATGQRIRQLPVRITAES